MNIICGFSVFGAPLAVITLLGSGLYAGMIMTVSILEFGFAGGVIGMGLLLLNRKLQLLLLNLTQ